VILLSVSPVKRAIWRLAHGNNNSLIYINAFLYQDKNKTKQVKGMVPNFLWKKKVLF
jgi:hypothetical protein